MYGNDGSYDEGVSYWGYTTLHMALFAEVLWRTRAIDDRNLINYPGTVRYALALTMPTVGTGLVPPSGPRNLSVPTVRVESKYDVVNFSDALSGADVSVAAWVARTHGDALAQHVARTINEAKFPFGLIWYDKATRATPPGPDLHDVRLSNDLVVSRTGWAAPDSVVALRSGGPGTTNTPTATASSSRRMASACCTIPSGLATPSPPSVGNCGSPRRTPPSSSTARATNITTAARARTPRGPGPT